MPSLEVTSNDIADAVATESADHRSVLLAKGCASSGGVVAESETSDAATSTYAEANEMTCAVGTLTTCVAGTVTTCAVGTASENVSATLEEETVKASAMFCGEEEAKRFSSVTVPPCVAGTLTLTLTLIEILTETATLSGCMTASVIGEHERGNGGRVRVSGKVSPHSWGTLPCRCPCEWKSC